MDDRVGELRKPRDIFRRTIDALLIEAVESGASIVMDDADWAGIRQSARSAVAKSVPPKSGGTGVIPS